MYNPFIHSSVAPVFLARFFAALNTMQYEKESPSRYYSFVPAQLVFGQTTILINNVQIFDGVHDKLLNSKCVDPGR